MKFLFITTGPGEYSILKPFVRYVQEQGDQAIFLISDNLLPILKAENPQDLDVDVFDSNLQAGDIFGRIKVTCDFYGIDVIVAKPTRGAMIHLQRPDGVKLYVSVEDNLQFRGVGNSYRLDTVLPTDLDIYAVNWHPEVLERALYHHYGITDLKAYPELQNKVHAIGWMPSKPVEHITDRHSYAMSYFGSGSNFNPGIVPKVIQAYFDIEKERKFLAVSKDVVTGNYPKLDLTPTVRDFDILIGNAREAYLHEGYGSINKCIANRVPVFSMCSKNRIKQMEIQPAADLGLVYKYDRPMFAEDIDGNELKEEIQKFRSQRKEIRDAQKKYAMHGEKNLYKLITDRI